MLPFATLTAICLKKVSRLLHITIFFSLHVKLYFSCFCSCICCQPAWQIGRNKYFSGIVLETFIAALYQNILCFFSLEYLATVLFHALQYISLVVLVTNFISVPMQFVLFKSPMVYVNAFLFVSFLYPFNF